MYRQLRAAIIESIAEDRLSPGEEAPSSRALAQSLGVSRTNPVTVQGVPS
ncbi:MAG: GntR family transcriptional regulator [Actinomycetia bacterium]|nr:GntR family transcriptional regulator [Actinomycetes bacterium]MCP4962482.1 GntR family transcriptional regulator [Actinomycetes bacterium]